jgi:hypothetical protein
MTTLQEFDKKAANYLDKLTTYVEGRVILEMLKPLIHQAIEEACLAGKEDEKKRVVEMIDGMKICTDAGRADKKLFHCENSYDAALSDLKQSIIK